MTIVFERPVTAADVPQTHALVIGVGRYPHLNGGDGERALTTMGLNQLSSPPVSARRFSEYLQTGFSNMECPLGSVELLISESGVNGSGIEPATFSNMEKACDRWYERCDGNEMSIGIFYFCGHGLRVPDTILLAEDFGQHKRRYWENAVNLTATHHNLAEMKAKTQLFIIDACRERPANAFEQLQGTMGRPLIHGSRVRFRERDARILYGAAAGKQASGQQHSVSYFTTALIDCMRRLGASQRTHKYGWVVDTNSLGKSLQLYIARLNQTGILDTELTCALGGESNFESALNWISDQDAAVMSTIACMPEDAMKWAELHFDNGNGHVEHRGPSPDHWLTELQAGVHYQLRAEIQSESPYAGARSEIKKYIHPPHADCRLEVD